MLGVARHSRPGGAGTAQELGGAAAHPVVPRWRSPLEIRRDHPLSGLMVLPSSSESELEHAKVADPVLCR